MTPAETTPTLAAVLAGVPEPCRRYVELGAAAVLLIAKAEREVETGALVMIRGAMEGAGR